MNLGNEWGFPKYIKSLQNLRKYFLILGFDEMCSFYTLETKLKLLNNSQIYIPLPSVALTSMHVRCAPKANIDAKLKQCMPLTIHVFIPNYGKFQIPKLFLMKEFY